MTKRALAIVVFLVLHGVVVRAQSGASAAAATESSAAHFTFDAVSIKPASLAGVGTENLVIDHIERPSEN